MFDCFTCASDYSTRGSHLLCVVCCCLWLQAVELRAELSRLQLPEVKGLKEDYINALLAHLLHPTTAAAAAAGGGGGGVSADPVQLTVQGVQLLQLLAPAVSAAAQQQLGPQEAASGLGLRALARCQVRLESGCRLVGASEILGVDRGQGLRWISRCGSVQPLGIT